MKRTRISGAFTLAASAMVFTACGSDVLVGPGGDEDGDFDPLVECPAGEERLPGSDECVPVCEAPLTRVGTECELVCAEGQEIIDGACVDECASGLTRVDGACVLVCEDGLVVVDGECVLVCEDGFEDVGGVCVPVCEPGTIRIEGVCQPFGVISGRICNGLIGAWLEGVTVSVTLPDGGSLASLTDASGAFLLEGVPPGVYYVNFEGPTYNNVIPVQVLPGEEAVIGDTICLPPPGHLTGKVCETATGTWLSNLTITIDDAAGSSAITDAFGKFIFYSVPAGDYTVTVHYADGSTETRPATVLSSQITDLGPATCDRPPDPCLTGSPTANAGADISAVPDQTVTLDGTGSSDPNGQPLTYNWRITSRPIGSSADVSNPNAASPTLLADVSGSFQVCLIVTDNEGCPSNEDCVTITVAPHVAFHIELVWDKDKTDVDLHYVRPGGAFFGPCPALVGQPDDVYFGCMTPDWGPLGRDGNTANDPRLDVDNVAGYGPENINMDTVYDGGAFKIGVHYWADHGTGAAIAVNARLRVYVDGVLSFEATSPAMQCGAMWDVARVQVSGNGTVVAITPAGTYTPGFRTLGCN